MKDYHSRLNVIELAQRLKGKDTSISAAQEAFKYFREMSIYYVCA